MRADIPEDWPNRTSSRVFRGPVHEWHVQECGRGAPVLLLHGAGGSVHSYRTLLPLLAEHYHILAPDLPGHGFTRLGSQARSGLEPMAQDLAALCAELEFRPKAIIGHSAGGAIALRMAQGVPDVRVVGINPALGKFEGVAGVLFPMVAKLLAALPFTGRLFSGAAARPERIRSLIENTGSRIDAEGLALYQRLVSKETHVKGALAMMAQWNLDEMLATLPELDARTLFITASNDQTVPVRVARSAALRMPDAQVTELDGYGHLVHEEIPEMIAEICRDFIDK